MGHYLASVGELEADKPSVLAAFEAAITDNGGTVENRLNDGKTLLVDVDLKTARRAQNQFGQSIRVVEAP